MVLEKKFLCFSHYKSMGVIDPQGAASLDSRQSFPLPDDALLDCLMIYMKFDYI